MSISGVSFTSSGAELAAMIVELESEAAERADQALESNKQRIGRLADEEYDAALAAADAAGRAAWISGAFTIAGGAVGVGAGVTAFHGASATNDAAAKSAEAQVMALSALGGTLSRLSESAGAFLAGRESAREQARAQRIGRSIEQASIEGEQLRQQAARSEQRADRALDQASRLIEGESARSSGVLSKF